MKRTVTLLLLALFIFSAVYAKYTGRVFIDTYDFALSVQSQVDKGGIDHSPSSFRVMHVTGKGLSALQAKDGTYIRQHADCCRFQWKCLCFCFTPVITKKVYL